MSRRFTALFFATLLLAIGFALPQIAKACTSDPLEPPYTAQKTAFSAANAQAVDQPSCERADQTREDGRTFDFAEVLFDPRQPTVAAFVVCSTRLDADASPGPPPFLETPQRPPRPSRFSPT